MYCQKSLVKRKFRQFHQYQQSEPPNLYWNSWTRNNKKDI